MLLPKELTQVPARNPNSLIGRAVFIDDLRKNLVDHKEIVLVNAMGGVGKTAIAEAYVGKYYDDYEHLAWIQQGEQEDFRLSFTTNGQLLSSLEINAEGKDIEGIFAEICTKLNNIDAKPKLLVIDNMTQAVIPYLRQLPKQPNWHVLYTSRESLEREQAWRMDLDFLSDEDAINLYRYYYDGPIDRAAILELVSRFGKHTLTIEILAKAQRKNRYSLEELQEALKLDLEIGATTAHSLDERVETIKSYLSRIFDMSKLEEQEIWLLKQFACLPTIAHSFTSLFDLLESKELERSMLSKLCTNLHEKGWLLYNSKEGSYRMHAIIHELVPDKYSIQQEEIAALLKKITEQLYIDQTKDNPIDKFPLAPFGQSLLTHLKVDNIEKIELQNNLAILFKYLGSYVEAKKLLEKAVSIYERNTELDQELLGPVYASLGIILRNLGDYQNARSTHEKALKANELYFGADHSETMKCYSNLAIVLQDLGDYSGAKELLEKVVRSDEQNFGDGHPSTARSYSNLALALKNLGDYGGAKELLEKAVYSAEENFGEWHPKTAVRYSNLAIVLQDLGDYGGAKELLEKAVRSDEQNFGLGHPLTALRYMNLAAVLQNLGNFNEAKGFFEKAVKSDKKNFGLNHPNTGRSYWNLATLLYKMEDYSTAYEYIQVAHNAYVSALPEEHPTLKNIRGWFTVIKEAYDKENKT